MKITALAFLGGFILGGGASLCLLSGKSHFAMGLQRFAEASRLRVMSGFGRKGAEAVESTKIDPAIVYADDADQELIARIDERVEAFFKNGGNAVESAETDHTIVYGDAADRELIARLHLTGADRERLEAIIRKGGES